MINPHLPQLASLCCRRIIINPDADERQSNSQPRLRTHPQPVCTYTDLIALARIDLCILKTSSGPRIAVSGVFESIRD
jgi:hypothetical protein